MLIKRKKERKPRLFVVGLDCAAPELVFDRWRGELPHLNRLLSAGAFGRLQSCTPCITVPAWSVMTSSKDPGALGIYGFRNRADHSYDGRFIANPSPGLQDLSSALPVIREVTP